MPDSKETSVRIDKWLWAVRVFKTRNQATEACKGGKVKIGGQHVKASREVKPGEIFTIQGGQIIKTIQVKTLLHNRVSAKLVPDYALDLTPAEEYEKLKVQKESFFFRRDRGLGRPTKKERRDIESFITDF